MLIRKYIYTSLLLFLPVLIIVTWVHVLAGNNNYAVETFLLLFILPAIIITVFIALITSRDLDKGYMYTFRRVFFTIVAVILSNFLYTYIMNFFGFNSRFLIVEIPQNIEQSAKIELASKFYSFELLYTMIALVLSYSLATHIFKLSEKPVKDKAPQKNVVKKKNVKKQKTAASTKTTTGKRITKKNAKNTIKKKAAKKK